MKRSLLTRISGQARSVDWEGGSAGPWETTPPQKKGAGVYILFAFPAAGREVPINAHPPLLKTKGNQEKVSKNGHTLRAQRLVPVKARPMRKLEGFIKKENKYNYENKKGERR